MSTEPYVSLKYANVDDFLQVLGLSESQIAAVTEEQRNRYQAWVIEGQNNTEAAVSHVSDDTPLVNPSEEYTFAKNAVLNWALYKKRQKDGSSSKSDAKEDYMLNIEYLRNVLIKNRSVRVKMAAILGKTQKDKNILLPSQIDTAFY